MLISSLTKKNVVFSNSGLAMSFDKKTTNLNLTIKGYDITVPVDLTQLEVRNFLTMTLKEARKGNLQQNAWENPEVNLNGKMNEAQNIALAYYIMQSFINSNGFSTRDIWIVPAFRGFHHSMLSYLRNRAITNELLMRYKVALLICFVKGYHLGDLSKIERTFEKCGLSRQNYIFYLLFLLDGTFENIEFDDQEKFILSFNSMENEKIDFIESASISRLCMFHTQKRLRFIVESHNLSPHEMANELKIATQIAYTTVRPLRSRAFSENYARRAMTNMALRIIHAYTHYPDKIRLVKGEHGSEGTHFSFDTLSGASSNIPHDPTWDDDCVKSSLSYSEDVMINYLDMKRAQAA
jgi:hypothetical protein